MVLSMGMYQNAYLSVAPRTSFPFISHICLFGYRWCAEFAVPSKGEADRRSHSHSALNATAGQSVNKAAVSSAALARRRASPLPIQGNHASSGQVCTAMFILSCCSVNCLMLSHTKNWLSTIHHTVIDSAQLNVLHTCATHVCGC
jgi:hypothetical protein